MEAPIIEIGHLEVDRMYDLYEEFPEDDEGIEWSTLPGRTATFLGIGDIYGGLVAVFRFEDPDIDLGGIFLLPEADLGHSTAVLPYDQADHGFS